MWQCPDCKRTFRHQDQNHYCTTTVASVDQYIAAQDEDVRPRLEQVRAAIRAAAPHAVETIAWQMPTYRLTENVIHFAAAKKHIGLYPGAEAVHVFADRLDGYTHSKGTIQLPLDRPLDLALITDITVWRVGQVEANAAAKSKKTGK